MLDLWAGFFIDSTTEIPMTLLLVTGGCGFIGSNFVRYLLETDSEISIVNLDLLTYAGNPANLADLAGQPGYRFVQGDILCRRRKRQIQEVHSARLTLLRL